MYSVLTLWKVKITTTIRFTKGTHQPTPLTNHDNTELVYHLRDA